MVQEEYNEAVFGFTDLTEHYKQANFHYITYLNFGHEEDYQRFVSELSQILALLKGLLMRDKTNRGVGDLLFSGILFQLHQKMDRTVAKPMTVIFEGIDLTLVINPILFFKYYATPKQMLAGLRQICYHILFNHLTEYHWAFQEAKSANAMSVAMEIEVNQYVEDLPHNSVGLHWIRQLLNDKGIPEKQGTLYYYGRLNAVDVAARRQSKSRTQTTFERMKNSGEMQELYTRFLGTLDPKKAKEVRIQALEQFLETMTHNLTSFPVEPDPDNQMLHQKLVNGIVRKSYQNIPQEKRRFLSENMKAIVHRLTKNRSLNWRDIIERGLGTTLVPYKLSKNRVNRRQPFRLDLPGRTLDQSSRLVAFFDTSASQNEEALNYSVSELVNIQKTLGTEVWVVQIDTEVKYAEPLNRQSVKNLKLKGRGGTSFAPAYEWLHRMGFTNQDTVSVYFTDGYGDDGFPRFGYHNMYWVLTDADPKKPSPLSTNGEGRVLYLRQDEQFNRRIINRHRGRAQGRM